MKKALILGLFCIISLNVYAATNPNEAMDERNVSLAESYHIMSVAFAEIFQKSAGFISGAHGFSPPLARKKFGFNVGLLGGVTSTDIDKTVANRSQNNAGVASFVKALPDSIPVPQTGINAHFGLPAFLVFESFDVGLRYHGISFATENISVDLTDIGLDLKGNIFEAGAAAPVTLTIGFSADSFKGNVGFLRSDTLSDSNTTYAYTATGSIKNGVNIDMNNQAFALRALASRKLLFFNPYLGVGAQINNGTTTSTGFQTGTVTMTGPGGPPAVSNAKVQGSASTPVGGLDMRLAGGFEFTFPFFYMSFNGEYGAISKGVGGTVQIGGQFR